MRDQSVRARSRSWHIPYVSSLEPAARARTHASGKWITAAAPGSSKIQRPQHVM